MDNSVVIAGRSLVADTLGFHLVFITFGVALPLLISVLELVGIKTKNQKARAIARSWSRALVVLFIAGAISGTIVSLQFSLLWPSFMALSGKVVGVSFALEGFAFLIEALFLSIYMLSWDRFKPIYHWLCSLPIVAGSLASAFFITTVNAWMNTPRGFQLDAHGNPININTRQAVFNPAVTTETTHSILAYIFACILVLLGFYAFILLRRKLSAEAKQTVFGLMKWLAVAAVIFGLAVAFAGDRAGKFIAKNESYKLAAAEGQETTEAHADLKVGGIVKGDTVRYAIKVPDLLSWLATGHTNGVVQGLDKIPKSERPPVIIHYFFDGMVAIGMITVLIPGIYLIGRKFHKSWANSKLMLRLFVVCAFAGLVALELGWMLTEFGRQPYVIRGVMRTNDALTHSKSVIAYAHVFPVLYLILFVLTYKALRRTAKPIGALS